MNLNNGNINYTPPGQIVILDAREIKDVSWSGKLGYFTMHLKMLILRLQQVAHSDHHRLKRISVY